MTKNRKPSRRSMLLEVLEDRAVPTSTAAAAAIAYQAENTQLTELNAGMNPAFATLASTVFAAETTFYNSTVGSSSSTTTTTPAAALSTLQGAITQAITTLQSTLTPQLSILPGNVSNLSSQVQAVLTGPSQGSMSNVMSSLLTAASAGTTDGSVPTTSLPILFQAVDNAITSEYESIAVGEYYFVTGQAYNSSGIILPNTGNNTSSAFDLATVNAAQNTAWTTAATSIFNAEAGLSASTGSAAATGASVASQVTTAIGTLTPSIVSSFASTPASANTGVLESLLDGLDGNSLLDQTTGLINLAATDSDGTVPASSLTLLETAVDDAIASSYNATAVSSFLLATSPVYPTVVTGTTD